MAGSTQDVSPRPRGRVPAQLTQRPPDLDEVEVGGVCWLVEPRLRDDFIGPDGFRLAEWLASGQARVVKKGPHRIVYRVDLPGSSFYLKHNLVPDWPSWFRQLVRPSKARMEFDRAQAVAARGVPTFQPLALGERRAFLGAGESFLITRSLEDTEPLHVFTANTLCGLPAERQTRMRQRLAVELGKLIARMHDAGITHNDLHAGNLLVRLDADDRLSLFLIDLNSVRIGAPLSWAKSQENLIILN